VPRVLTVYLALTAGLTAGFGSAGSRASLIGVGLGLAAVTAALLRRHAPALALGAAAAGVLCAHRANASDAHCRAALLRGAVVLARLEHDGAPGAYVRARAVRPCSLDLGLGVDRGSAPAGAYVVVRGLAWPAGRGMRVPDATIVPTGEVAVLPAWRAQAGRTLDRLFGADAPLARALVVADARAIDAAVRDRYADAGLVHALSVSGLHVAIVASGLALLLRAARVPGPLVHPMTVAAVAGYVALIGAPAPAVRAGVMLGVSALAGVLQRPTAPWAVFALGAAAPLVDPRVVTDLGYQLSVAGMAALVAGRHSVARLRAFARSPDRVEVAWRRRLREAARGVRRGWRATMASELVVGLYAAVATAPLVAWHFGRVSVVGVASNLVAGPVLALLQPTLFLALLLAPVPPAANLVADAARPLLRGLDAAATAAALVPGGVVVTSPSLAGAVLAGAAAVALLAAASARRRRGAALAACAAALAGATWVSALGSADAHVELHAIDVGQGDAVALRTPRGRWVLFDAGRGGRGYDAGARTVVPYLRRRGGALAALVLSHPHADHVGGAGAVVRRLRPSAVWDAGFALGSATYRDVLVAAREAGARWHRVRPGERLAIDGVTVTVLAPDSAWTAGLRDPNLASVVLRVQFGRVRFLLTGDAEAPEEDWLRAHAAPDDAEPGRDALSADVLKVAHHGSRTSTSAAFLGRVRPRVALISVGGATPTATRAPRWSGACAPPGPTCGAPTRSATSSCAATAATCNSSSQTGDG
jgi:competence protein ComEC